MVFEQVEVIAKVITASPYRKTFWDYDYELGQQRSMGESGPDQPTFELVEWTTLKDDPVAFCFVIYSKQTTRNDFALAVT